MERTERPLRFTVEKWLAMAHAMSARITRGSRARSNQARSFSMHRGVDINRCVCNLPLPSGRRHLVRFAS